MIPGSKSRPIRHVSPTKLEDIIWANRGAQMEPGPFPDGDYDRVRCGGVEYRAVRAGVAA